MHGQHLLNTYARFDTEFARGEGARLWDADGNEYLDFLAGISVSSVGHCHPRVVEAIAQQAARLIHVGNLYYTDPMARLADRLAAMSLGGGVFFTNSGAEAIEAAIKVARKAKQGGDIITFHRAFHGRTYGALSATPQESKQAPFAPLVPGFRAIERDDGGDRRAGRRPHRGGDHRADPGRDRRPCHVRRGARRRRARRATATARR